MALVIESLPRVFVLELGANNKVEINDPNPDLTPDEVKDLLAHQYPEIVSSKVEGPKLTADNQIFTMSSGKVGVKG